MPIHIPVAKAKYVWVYGVDPNTSKGAVIGPFRDEDTARENTREFDAVRVWELPTRDQSKASGMIKAKLAQSHGLKYALSRKRRVKTGEKNESDESTERDTLFDDAEDE